MPDLFSPLSVGGLELPNRIVMGPAPSGLAVAGGFASAEVAAYYERRALGGAGLLVSERLLVTPPDDPSEAHLGLYDDAFVPELRRVVDRAHAHGACVLFTLDAAPPALEQLSRLVEAFALAAWRAHGAGADGVMLTAADGGVLHRLLSPLHNRRADAYGGALAGRLRLALELVETVRRWIGPRLVVGFRLLADELIPGGMTLQDARVVAKRVTAAGVRLIDVTAAPDPAVQVARFPGWIVPLASSIKRIIDVPVIGSGLLSDPHLADSVIRDGSVDLVMLEQTLRLDPDWPRAARAALASDASG
ncbi:MAG: NADH:flavin oxidoreductase [Chloroflexi bacterium OHK40]